jgi:hypothetical protein
LHSEVVFQRRFWTSRKLFLDIVYVTWRAGSNKQVVLNKF